MEKCHSEMKSKKVFYF